MLRTILIFLLFSFSLSGYAQQTNVKAPSYTLKTRLITNTLVPGVTEKYYVFDDKDEVKHGLYQAFYKRKTLIAFGHYNNGKKVGIWRFYNSMGHVVQVYDYDKKQLIAGNDELTAGFVAYEYLPKPEYTDSVSYPLKIGGVLYGYLNYISKFKVNIDYNFPLGSTHGVLQILVSPGGRLAECTLLVRGRVWRDNRLKSETLDKYVLNPELLSEEDKLFVPAKVNGQNVPVTINLFCFIKANGKIALNDERY